MKFYDIDVLARKYGDGNKYLATSIIAESACRLSEKRNPDENNPEKEKYLSEVLAHFDKGVDIEKVLREKASHENHLVASMANIVNTVNVANANE
ncbi:MAG: hypothetical protein FWF87_05935 [Synergistaceae bacterium]|nr:hypothetical protein [Synergistaceae bacterium]